MVLCKNSKEKNCQIVEGVGGGSGVEGIGFDVAKTEHHCAKKCVHNCKNSGVSVAQGKNHYDKGFQKKVKPFFLCGNKCVQGVWKKFPVDGFFKECADYYVQNCRNPCGFPWPFNLWLYGRKEIRKFPGKENHQGIDYHYSPKSKGEPFEVAYSCF